MAVRDHVAPPLPVRSGLHRAIDACRVLQTIWLKTGKDNYLRHRVLRHQLAAGVVTGIVRQFQFGMTCTEYPRLVGDVSGGAPLTPEARLASFLQSTFIGLGILGRDKLPRKLHPAFSCCVRNHALHGVQLAANSWLQNPVGATFRNGRTKLTDSGAVLTNAVFLTTFPHQIASGHLVAGGLVAGLCGWHLPRLLVAPGGIANQVFVLDQPTEHLDTPTAERLLDDLWRHG